PARERQPRARRACSRRRNHRQPRLSSGSRLRAVGRKALRRGRGGRTAHGMTSKELTLAAEDAEDLEVISARLQDAVTQVKELVWLHKSHRFACLFNRFKWETVAEKRKADLRVKSRLYFDDVIAVRSQKIRRDAPDGVLSLLTVRFTPK